MELVFVGNRIRILVKALTSLAALGEHLIIESYKDVVKLRTRSPESECTFSFGRTFFAQLDAGQPLNNDTNAAENDADQLESEAFIQRFTTPVKALLTLFRQLQSFANAVETCRIQTDFKAQRLLVKVDMNNGFDRADSLYIVNPSLTTSASSIYELDEPRNSFTMSADIMYAHVAAFRHEQDEVILFVKEDFVELVSDRTADVLSDGQSIVLANLSKATGGDESRKSDIERLAPTTMRRSIGLDEFVTHKFPDPDMSMHFYLHDLRPFLEFGKNSQFDSKAGKWHVHCHWGQPGFPICFGITASDQGEIGMQGDLMMSTVKTEEESTPKAKRIRQADPTGYHVRGQNKGRLNPISAGNNVIKNRSVNADERPVEARENGQARPNDGDARQRLAFDDSIMQANSRITARDADVDDANAAAQGVIAEVSSERRPSARKAQRSVQSALPPFLAVQRDIQLSPILEAERVPGEREENDVIPQDQNPDAEIAFLDAANLVPAVEVGLQDPPARNDAQISEVPVPEIVDVELRNGGGAAIASPICSIGQRDGDDQLKGGCSGALVDVEAPLPTGDTGSDYDYGGRSTPELTSQELQQRDARWAKVFEEYPLFLQSTGEAYEKERLEFIERYPLPNVPVEEREELHWEELRKLVFSQLVHPRRSPSPVV